MDETPKKPNISDLKARLGLKKAGAAGPAPAPGDEPQQQMGQQQQMGAPVPLPPPPGFPVAAPIVEEEPTPVPAADPRRDPFAQQPPQAPVGYYGYQPLPGTDDGTAPAPIEKPKPWGKIGIAIGVALALFVVGNACGRIYDGRLTFNKSTDDAAKIRGEVDKMAKNLGTINDLINGSVDVAKGNPDIKLAGDLGGLNLKKPDSEKIFHTNYYRLEDMAIDRLFNYYNDTLVLYEMVEKHAKQTDADKDAIESFMKSGAGKTEKNYGIIMDTSGPLTLATFIEVGAPVCPQEGQTDCAATELKGFKYRVETGGNWFEKPVKGNPKDILVPIKPNPLFKTVASGSPDLLAVKDYARRMNTIRGYIGKLMNEQKELLNDLKRASERPKVFTF